MTTLNIKVNSENDNVRKVNSDKYIHNILITNCQGKDSHSEDYSEVTLFPEDYSVKPTNHSVRDLVVIFRQMNIKAYSAYESKDGQKQVGDCNYIMIQIAVAGNDDTDPNILKTDVFDPSNTVKHRLWNINSILNSMYIKLFLHFI